MSWRKPEPPTPKPKPEETTSAEFNAPLDFHDSHHSHESDEIWMPSGGWSSDTDVIKTLSESDENEADRRNENMIRKVNNFLKYINTKLI